LDGGKKKKRRKTHGRNHKLPREKAKLAHAFGKSLPPSLINLLNACDYITGSKRHLIILTCEATCQRIKLI
jgi:hypothetical protein